MEETEESLSKRTDSPAISGGRFFPRPGIPPIHPSHPQIPPPQPAPSPANSNPFPSHSRSISQPPFFSLDSLPSFADLNADNSSKSHLLPQRRDLSFSEPLPPPRKAHRRSHSDIPYAFLHSGLPPLPLASPAKRHAQVVKQEAECDSDLKSEEDAAGEDLICAYMNLESLDTLNSSGTEEKSKASGGSKTNGAESSENEAESSMNEGLSRMEGHKRSAVGDVGGVKHCRSLSMDSFMGRLNFGDEMGKMPCGSVDGLSGGFSLEFGNGEFSSGEMKKIMANEKLAEIAMNDPKRAKRCLKFSILCEIG